MMHGAWWEWRMQDVCHVACVSCMGWIELLSECLTCLLFQRGCGWRVKEEPVNDVVITVSQPRLSLRIPERTVFWD